MQFNTVMKHYYIDYCICEKKTGRMVVAGDIGFSCPSLAYQNIQQAKRDILDSASRSHTDFFVKINAIIQLDKQ